MLDLSNDRPRVTDLDFQVFQQLPGLVNHDKMMACTNGICTDSGTSCVNGSTLPRNCPVQSAQCWQAEGWL